MALCGCGKSDASAESAALADTTSADTGVVAPASEDMTEEKMKDTVLTLANSVRDNGLCETNITADFFRLYTQATSAPGTCPGGIGDEEVLFYVIGGQDPDPKGTVTEVTFSDFSPEKATCTLKFQNYGEPEIHRMEIVNVDGSYLISDWDNLKEESRKYITKINRLIAGNGAARLLRQLDIDESDEFYQDYIGQVEDYKKTYGVK